MRLLVVVGNWIYDGELSYRKIVDSPITSNIDFGRLCKARGQRHRVGGVA